MQEPAGRGGTDGAYNAAVEKLVARAEALRPAPIREQMAKAGQ